MSSRPQALPDLDYRQTLESLPPIWPDSGLRAQIRRRLEASATSVVVIDDDPTGTQTVHGVPVLTTWALPELEGELAAGTTVFYLLSNSRALPREDAVGLARGMGANLRRAAAKCGRRLEVISRSDSTLRGHYPAETDALAQGLGFEPDAVLIAPYFREGGRFTIGDVHYVLQGSRLVPAARTEYALDPAFAYRHSDLRRWVEEKSAGRWQADKVTSISLETIRSGGPKAVLAQLLPLCRGVPVIVNACDDRDLEVVVAAIAEAGDRGKRFLYRTAASFAKVRGGIADRPLLTPQELPAVPDSARGGLVVVGSYVPRTTRQLQHLLDEHGWVPIELKVSALLDPAAGPAELAAALAALQDTLGANQNAVLYTSRELVTGATEEESLAIGQIVSRGLVQILRELPMRPRFLVAKGGITASDLATEALGVRRAMVLGQIAPGVPVWELGSESRYPGLAYVVFPGNVGTDSTLCEVARLLST